MATNRMPIPFWRSLMLLVLLAPFAASADLLLISRVSSDTAPAKAAYLWVGESALRFDNGQQALIADFTQRRVHVLDHETRTVSSADIGKAKPALPVVQAQPGSTTIRRWTAREYRLNWPEYGLSSRVHVSDIDGIDSAEFTRAVRKLTGVPGAQWLAALADLPGIPVRIETTRSNADGTVDRQVRDTVNVIQRTPPVATYRIPSSYKPR